MGDRRFVCVAFLLWFSGIEPAISRGVHLWSIKELAQKADVLVVGEVIEVTLVEGIRPDMTHWNISLLRMAAKIRVLRAYAQDGSPPIQEEKPLILIYEAIDWEKDEHYSTALDLHEFAVGDIFAFPLRRETEQEAFIRQRAWRLLDEENHGSVIPAQKEGIHDAPGKSGVEFLESELAGAFASHDYATVYLAAKSSVWKHPSDASTERVFKLLEVQINDDENQWLAVGTAIYCAAGTPKQKISDLLRHNKMGKDREMFSFILAVLQKLSPEKLEERLVRLAVQHCDIHPYGTGVTIMINDHRHAVTAPLLKAKLGAGDASALVVVETSIKETDDPLLPVALKASRDFAEKAGVKFARVWISTVVLILRYGKDQDVEFLAQLIGIAKKTDHTRFTNLWRSCMHASTPRVICVARQFIDDKDLCFPNWRICDAATQMIESAAGVKFGMDYKQPVQVRDAAVEKAKNWLIKNPGMPKLR